MKKNAPTPSGATPRLAAPGAPLDFEQVLTGLLSGPPKKKKQSRPRGRRTSLTTREEATSRKVSSSA